MKRYDGRTELTEKQWSEQVLDMCRLGGWKYYHTYDSRRSVHGFPDLVLVRERVIFVELKSPNGKLTGYQGEWISRLRQAGADAQVWRPEDYERIQRLLLG